MRIAPRPTQGQEISIENLLERPKNPATDPEVIPGTTESVIIETDTYWRLSPIKLRAGRYTYDLSKNALDNGDRKYPTAWVLYSRDRYLEGGFVAAAGDVMFSIMDFLHSHVNDPIFGTKAQNAWEYLAKRFNTRDRPMMLTRCDYNPRPEPDEVAHDFGLPTSYNQHGALRGEVESIGKLSDADEYTRLMLGCADSSHVIDVISGLNPNPWIWRYGLDHFPKVHIITSLVLGGTRFGIDSTYSGDERLQAIGVAQRKKF